MANMPHIKRAKDMICRRCGRSVDSPELCIDDRFDDREARRIDNAPNTKVRHLRSAN